jgi:hypothetical protein
MKKNFTPEQQRLWELPKDQYGFPFTNTDVKWVFNILTSAHVDVYKNLPNPSLEVQVFMIHRNPRLIILIKEPSEFIKWVTLRTALANKTHEALGYIPSPTIEMQLKMVAKNGDNIQFIRDPAPQVIEAAVKRNSRAIAYVKNPSKELQLLAVSKNYYAIADIHNPDEDVQMAAISKHADAIKYIKNPTDGARVFATLRR